MKVAIVHDWLYGGGAEKVVEQLHLMYPEAPIYTSYCSDEWRERLDGKVVTGYLQYTPFRQLRKFLPLLRQWWFRSLNLSEFDLIISSTGNGEAKFVRATKPGSRHVCYCHTPVHFYWRHYNEYLRSPGFKPAWLARLGLKVFAAPLRRADFRAAQKVDKFIANSSQISKDIKKYYKRDSEVIFPPVDVTRFTGAKLPDQKKGFVTVGRQVPMKRFDLAIQAAKELQVPLTIIGNGPEHSRLVGMTGPTVHFRTDVTDAEMPELLAAAEAFLFMSHEDFGIAPVEALAAGTPVIAYGAGGALDYVVPGKTGEFFDHQTTEHLVQAMQGFETKRYKPEKLRAEARKYSTVNFRKQIKATIDQAAS